MPALRSQRPHAASHLLGLWHHFGAASDTGNAPALCRKAFDFGITHFGLANNCGPPPGAAETAFGEILRPDFAGRRDEMIIASKAGYRMCPGPYGEWGSRKYLIASCDQSLKRMGLDYVDIFHSHRFDPATPLAETMGAKLNQPNAQAAARGQTLAQMALAWVLKDARVTSALIGANHPEQIRECVSALDQPAFETSELAAIEGLTGPVISFLLEAAQARHECLGDHGDHASGSQCRRYGARI